MNIVNGIKSSTTFAKLPLRYFERFVNTSLQYACGLLNSHFTRVSIKSFHVCLKSFIRRRRGGRRQIKSVYAEFKYGFYSRAINVFIASRKFNQKLLCLFLNFINRINQGEQILFLAILYNGGHLSYIQQINEMF